MDTEQPAPEDKMFLLIMEQIEIMKKNQMKFKTAIIDFVEDMLNEDTQTNI